MASGPTTSWHIDEGNVEIVVDFIFLGFPGGSEVKASACNAGDLGSIPGSGRFPWRRKWQPTPVFLPGESHGQRSLVGYSPRGCKESDTTEQLYIHFTFTLGSKIIMELDCSHKIKRHLLLGRKKGMKNLDSVLKSRDSLCYRSM